MLHSPPSIVSCNFVPSFRTSRSVGVPVPPHAPHCRYRSSSGLTDTRVLIRPVPQQPEHTPKPDANLASNAFRSSNLKKTTASPDLSRPRQCPFSLRNPPSTLQYPAGTSSGLLF